MALVQGDADRYQLGVCIGRGSYGDVYKGSVVLLVRQD